MKNTVVAYYAGDKSLIYALAACLKAGFPLHPASCMQELWDIEAEKLILLEIDESKTAFPDFDVFYQTQVHRIIGRIKAHDLYVCPAKISANIFTEEILKEYCANSRLYDDIKQLRRDISAAAAYKLRHQSALYSALIKAANTADINFYYRTLENVELEMRSGKVIAEIDILANCIQRIEYSTQSAFDRISVDHELFHIPNREVAYAFLSNASPWIDWQELKNKAKKNYGYLVILQYRRLEHDITWVASDQLLNVCQFFDLPREGDAYDFTLIGSHRFITKLLREKILEITS